MSSARYCLLSIVKKKKNTLLKEEMLKLHTPILYHFNMYTPFSLEINEFNFSLFKYKNESFNSNNGQYCKNRSKCSSIFNGNLGVDLVYPRKSICPDS